MKFFFTELFIFIKRENNREIKRLFFKFFKSFNHGLLYLDCRNLIREKNFSALQNKIKSYIDSSISHKDYRFLYLIYSYELRLGRYVDSINHEFLGYKMHRSSTNDLVSLDDISKKDKLVIKLKEFDGQAVGSAISFFGLVKRLSSNFKNVYLFVEPRAILIWKRSLKNYRNIKILGYNSYSYEVKRIGSYFFVNSTILKYLYIKDIEDIKISLDEKMVANIKKISELRKKYRKLNLPIIGLVYKSSNTGKETPDIKFWKKIIENFQANYLILQIGAINNEVEAFQKSASKSKSYVVLDQSIDFKGDLDDHFSQISSIDALISMPSSLVPFSNALGTKSIVILDNLYTRNFPINESYSPWFPHATFFHKKDRDYSCVFDEVLEYLKKTKLDFLQSQ